MTLGWQFEDLLFLEAGWKIFTRDGILSIPLDRASLELLEVCGLPPGGNLRVGENRLHHLPNWFTFAEHILNYLAAGERLEVVHGICQVDIGQRELKP